MGGERLLVVTIIVAILLLSCYRRRKMYRPVRDCTVKIAVLVYNFGGYDKFKPKLVGDVDGYFYTTEGSMTSDDLTFLRAHGWTVVFTTKSKATANNGSDRLTSKRLKWNSSPDFKHYDFVVTHDCNVYIDYRKIRKFIASEMDGCSVLFKDWPYDFHKADCSFRIFWEINDFLTNRLDRIQKSKEETIMWRDMLLNDETYDPEPYFETNVFIFRPNCERYQKFGKRVYEYCHKLQRDQFIVPYVLLQENVPYKVKSQKDLIRDISFKVLGNHSDSVTVKIWS